jgi:hypothetical protein
MLKYWLVLFAKDIAWSNRAFIIIRGRPEYKQERIYV